MCHSNQVSVEEVKEMLLGIFEDDFNHILEDMVLDEYLEEKEGKTK